MKKSTLLFAAALMLSVTGIKAQGVYQIGNSDFESWSNTNEPGGGWYSFVSADASALSSFLRTMAINQSKVTTTSTTGHTGKGVQLQSKSMFGANANGNLTTGQIHMGSTTPSATSNYNYTNRSGSNCCQLAGRPDSLVFWGKFTRGTVSSGGNTYTGRAKAIIHGDYDYKDPYETTANETSYKVAEAIVYSTVTSEWTRYSGPFTYTSLNPSKMYILISFTTNETPGGSYNDYFYIDDVELIYNSGIKTITINGTPLAGFDPDVYEYDIDEFYGEGSLRANGKTVSSVVKDPYAREVRATDPSGTTVIEVVDNTASGTADVSGSYDTTTFKYTLTVKGQDYATNPANVKTYTLQFLDPATGIDQIRTDVKSKQEGIYDLQGRRLKSAENLPAGLYIINGKKTLIK